MPSQGRLFYGVPWISPLGFQLEIQSWSVDFVFSWPHPLGWKWHRSDFVYFARSANGTIKIGYSKNPVSRVAGLRGHELLVITRGNQAFEQTLHRWFAHYSVQRKNAKGRLVTTEWYRANSPVVNLAYRLKNAADSSLLVGRPYARAWRRAA